MNLYEQCDFPINKAIKYRIKKSIFPYQFYFGSICVEQSKKREKETNSRKKNKSLSNLNQFSIVNDSTMNKKINLYINGKSSSAYMRISSFTHEFFSVVAVVVVFMLLFSSQFFNVFIILDENSTLFFSFILAISGAFIFVKHKHAVRFA